MKIAILGYSGSGKSTLTKVLSSFYDIPFLHLDTVQFSPNWIERDRDEAKSIVSEFMKNTSWVIDGNYRGFYQEERLEQSDKIIFLNFPRRICFFRAYNRYLENKNKTRADMAKGCIEKFDLEFAWWILYNGRTKEIRNHFESIGNKYSEKIIVLKKPQDIENYLHTISPKDF